MSASRREPARRHHAGEDTEHSWRIQNPGLLWVVYAGVSS